MAPLEGKTIAILVSNYGVEQAELVEPRQAIIDVGAKVVIIGVEDSDVQTLIGDKDPGDTFAVDATTYPSVGTDIRNAGGSWRDDQVVVCHENEWPLITSRTPKDLGAFNRAIVEEFAREEATV